MFEEALHGLPYPLDTAVKNIASDYKRFVGIFGQGILAYRNPSVEQNTDVAGKMPAGKAFYRRNVADASVRKTPRKTLIALNNDIDRKSVV